MTDPETCFYDIGCALKDAEASQMFGKKCFKVGGKAFVSFFNECMVFKLSANTHATALALSGSVLFDPSGKGRAMREWVQVSYEHHALWPKFAAQARLYVLENL